MTETNYTITEREVQGDIIVNRRNNVEQGSAEEFIEAIDAILNLPKVKKIKWTQYTPYFNDGEPCEFTINDLRVRIKGDDKDVGDYEDGYRSSWDLYDYTNGFKDREFIEIAGADVPALYEALNNFPTGRFEAVAQANFGDHAEVTATKAGFSVEYYEHD